MRVPLQSAMCLLLAAASTPLAAQPPAALSDCFARLDKTAQTFKGLVADIKRDVYTAVIDEHERNTGAIRVKREKARDTRMLIDFTGPDARSVLLDAANVSVYLPKSKVVQVFDLGGKRDLVDQFLLLGFGATSAELRERYDVTFIGSEKPDGEDAWHIQLVPKSKDALKNLKKAELWISRTSGLPVEQRFVTSATGDFTLIAYSNVKMNPPLPESALKLNVPKGVTVEHPKL